MIKRILFLFSFFLFSFLNNIYGFELFDKEETIQYGLNVFELSNDFADIYEKLNSIEWGGKKKSISVNNLDKFYKGFEISSTSDRIIFLFNSNMISNYKSPKIDDWKAQGQLTTALILKLRSIEPKFLKLSKDEIYQIVVKSLMHSIDESGKYISDKNLSKFGTILTSLGINGYKSKDGNFYISGIIQNSVAYDADINIGDIVTEINGISVNKIKNSEFINILYGHSSTVKLTIKTKFGNRKVVLRSASIILADTDITLKKLNNDLNLLEIVVHKITDNSVAIINEALKKYSNLSGIVLDLRNTFGSDEIVTAKLAGLFLGKKPIMRIIESDKSEAEIISSEVSKIDIPTVVLISSSTRGTAEALAYSFYENKKGILIGTPTLGNAYIPVILNLKNTGKLEVFNKVFKSGMGNTIYKKGVFPIVCLSNIKGKKQQDSFFVNINNNSFKYNDFNKRKDLNAKHIRFACPNMNDGKEEDVISSAISAKILTDKKVYNKLIGQNE